MKSRYTKVFVFAGKSFLWAAVLYGACLAGLYKDDIEKVVSTSRSFGINVKVHAFQQVADTTILPNIPHTGIFLSSRGIRSIEVSMDGLMRVAGMFRK